MGAIHIYVDLPPTLIQVLNENQLTLDGVLQSSGIDAAVEYAAMPYAQAPGARSKDVVPLIVASAGLVLSIGLAVSTILKTIYRRPIVTKILEPEELRDARGNLVKDTEGNPQYKLRTRYEMLEPRPEDRQTTLELQAGTVVLRFSTVDTQSA